MILTVNSRQELEIRMRNKTAKLTIKQLYKVSVTQECQTYLHKFIIDGKRILLSTFLVLDRPWTIFSLIFKKIKKKKNKQKLNIKIHINITKSSTFNFYMETHVYGIFYQSLKQQILISKAINNR